MKKTICGKLYDTNESTLVKKFTFGAFGEAEGYEESLYETKDGAFFEYANGGAESKHNKEEIKRISKQNVTNWLKTHE